MRKKNISLIKNRVGILMLAFLLCAGILAGCGKDNGTSAGNGTPDAGAATATIPATATSSPTPTVPFMETAYENIGMDDV